VWRIADGGLEKNAVFTQIYEKEQREERTTEKHGVNNTEEKGKKKEEREMVYFH